MALDQQNQVLAQSNQMFAVNEQNYQSVLQQIQQMFQQTLLEKTNLQIKCQQMHTEIEVLQKEMAQIKIQQQTGTSYSS